MPWLFFHCSRFFCNRSMGIGTVLKSPIFIRFMASNSYKPQGFNVTVIGAAGGIGQPLSLLLKQNPLVKKLKLYDLAKIVVGVGVDLSHIGTYTKVETFIGDKLHDALKDADVVMISAGLPRKPGMNRDDLFSANADVAYKMGSAIADSCPCALVGIITNPVNSTVPILAEAMYKKKKLDPRKIFGVTTLDLVRAETFCAEINGTDPLNQRVPVVGGHAGTTIVPLLSQACPPLCDLSDECRDKLIARIQEAGTEVVKAKDGGGSATLSMAYAGARFTNSLLLALNGQKVLEYAYVRSSVTPSSYFSGPVVLNQNGIKEVLCLGTLDNHEVQLVAKAVPQLQKSIAAALEFAKKKDNC